MVFGFSHQSALQIMPKLSASSSFRFPHDVGEGQEISSELVSKMFGSGLARKSSVIAEA